jgi:hypothetical protein
MMNRLLMAFASIVCLTVSAQTASPSAGKFGPQWRLLIGEWTSEPTAAGGTGSCAFRFDLGGHILVRTNHAELPVAGSRGAGKHDDLMVIYPGASEAEARATYWDNEGHVIEYSASWSADGSLLTFLSKPGAGPQFRLTYKKLAPNSLSVSFDLAAPDQAGAFKTYTSGHIRRRK